MKVGVLLINLGTPDSPSVADVRKYLTRFLNDPSVIDINPIARFFLVNFIIVPFRARKSAVIYKKIWTKDGSPLIAHTRNLAMKLQAALNNHNPASHPSSGGNSFIVEYGMRYRNPGIQSAFKKLLESEVDNIIAVPLFPQYASSTTGSAIKELKAVMKKEEFYDVKIIDHFFQNNCFLDAWSEVSKKYFSVPHEISEGHDFFLFSYHGLPERQVLNECKKRGGQCKSINDCETNNIGLHYGTGQQLPTNDSSAGQAATTNPYCYLNSCFETTRQLVKRLSIPEGKYATSFQSRFGRQWLKPFSDKVVIEKAKKGVKRMLVFSPSFVADCLETKHEIAVEYSKIFEQNGGAKLQLVESLNDSDAWVEALTKIVTTQQIYNVKK